MNERDIFNAARHIAGDERNAYLEQACAGDMELRGRVDKLLRAHDLAGSFLQSPVVDRPDTVPEVDDSHPVACSERTQFDVREVPLDFLSPSDNPDSLGRFGPYEIGEVIGRGGMGIVLKARDASLDRVVAIKVLAPELASNATARKRFLREAKTAAAVTHQHVVTIHAVGEDRLPYLVMECVSGQSLQDKLDEQGPLDLREVLRIGTQIAAGLAAAHANGVIHRDIKPANILLENGIERVRITDFGLARAVDDVAMTRTGEVAGTPQYMSPEQAQGQPLDVRSDLFSFGSVLYAMCTGRPPFRAESTIDAIRRVCDDTPRPIREINADVPEWLMQIVDRLLAKQPEERFQTAAEVSDLLGQYLAHEQNAGSAPQPVMPRSRGKNVGPRASGRAHTRWGAAILVFLAVLSALGVTEATGVTHLAGTVVRIVTGEGTLVIEVDDPTVQVSLDGEELTISGGGVQEVRLRPGQYQFMATRDGQPVKQELITVTRGGERIVTVSREGIEPTIIVAEPAAERGAFVLLGSADVAERRFDTLAETVLDASEGGAIEIRGNGPFETSPITIQQPLVIRAGDGFRPVIRLRAGATGHVLLSSAPLVLEGLEIQYRQEQLSGELLERDLQQRDGVVKSTNAMLTIANCRLIGDGKRSIVQAWSSPSARIVNSELLNSAWDAVSWNCSSSASLTLDNCILAAPGTGYLANTHRNNGPLEYSISISRCTSLMGGGTLGLRWALEPPELTDPADLDSPRIAVELVENVLDAPHPVITLRPADDFTTAVYDLPGDQRTLFLPGLFEWREQYNLFRGGNEFCRWSMRNSNGRESRSSASRDEWTARFPLEDAQALQGVPRFEGGDLRARLAADPLSLAPNDFRLNEGSPGYRAGPDGNDLGANVDLVGPGEAYGRWKRTPEYQQWLEETGQLRRESRQAPSDEWVWTAPVNLDAPINSEYGEGYPFVSADGLTLLFSSDRPGGQGQSDIWQSTRPSPEDSWSAPVNLGEGINTAQMEIGPFLSADGLTLYVSSGRRGGHGNWDIWIYQRETPTAAWSDPINPGSPINGPWGEVAPCLTSDGLILLFQTDRPGGQGAADLWISRRTSLTANWMEPVPLGPSVNTEYEEWRPRLTGDGRSLLFGSDRPGGSGSMDLWMSRGASPFGPWTQPINLGVPLNGSGNDKSPALSSNDAQLYFESGRSGNLGSHDIWMATRVPNIDYPSRANELAKQGRLEAAAADFALALNLVSELPAGAPERQRIGRQIVQLDGVFERVVALRPQDIFLWSFRGDYLAQQERWREAADCYQRRLDLGPDGAGLWNLCANSMLAQGDIAGYRNFCERMLAAFADEANPGELILATWVMVLLPDAVADKSKAFRLAERALAAQPDSAWALRNHTAWLYRLDRLEEVIAAWNTFREPGYEEYRLCFLAMAHHRLGNTGQARQYADEVEQRKPQWSTSPAWPFRVEVETLQRETEAVLAAAPDANRNPPATQQVNRAATSNGPEDDTPVQSVPAADSTDN